MKLADKIRQLPPSLEQVHAVWASSAEAYEYGFYHAKLDAQRIATAHDALMQQMAEALERAEPQVIGGALIEIRAALRAYKEQQ